LVAERNAGAAAPEEAEAGAGTGAAGAAGFGAAGGAVNAAGFGATGAGAAPNFAKCEYGFCIIMPILHQRCD
jgi:hypothetical protein